MAYFAPYNPNTFVPTPPPAPIGPPQEVLDLEALLPFLDSRDVDFAKSLLKQANERRFLSEKQFYWVTELARRGRDNQAVAQAKTTSAPVAQALPNGFDRIIRLFDRAYAAGIKSPKIRMETEAGTKVIFRRLASGRYPGQISVTDNAKTFQTRVYFGRIDQAGVFHPTEKNRDDVTALLIQMAADPAKAAAAYGHRCSSCCFCGRELKTRESVAVGYGPICAEKFGLPWGEVAPPTFTTISTEDLQ